MKSIFATFALLVSASSAFAAPSVVCDAKNASEDGTIAHYQHLEHLELAENKDALVTTREVMPGAPTLKLEKAMTSSEDGSVVLTGSVHQAIACPGSCGTKTFELKISKEAVSPNGQFTLNTSRFNEAVGARIASEYKQTFYCVATDIDQLPSYEK